MAMKHRITINVTDPHGNTGTVLKGADVRLPANWQTEYPNPVLEALIQSPLIDTDAGTYYWTDWYVDENFVLHAAMSCEYNEAYLFNPELIPRKTYDRAAGVWVVQ